jgi:Rad3-related DNA helicase
MRERLDELFGDGYSYVYLVPAMRKVIQAAGRVIRSTDDRGTLFLIDDRYTQPKIRALLPDWWRLDAQESSELPWEAWAP